MNGGSGPIERCTISELLREAARRFGDAEAVVAPVRNVRWSFRDLDARADEVAAGCIALGLGPGDRAVVYAPNLPEWLSLQYGLARAGVTLVTANTALKGAELSYILSKSGAKALFFARATPSNDLEGVVRGLDRSQVKDLRHTIGLDGASCNGSRSLAEFLGDGARARDRIATIERSLSVDDVINMQYTSGTTGFPKGVMLTHRNLVQNAAVISPILGYSPSDRLCVTVPLFHCFGCVIATLASHNSGVALVLVETFNADVALDTCERERATALYGVPTMFVAQLEAQRRKPRKLNLRVGVMAGAFCPEALVREVIEQLPLPGLVIAYGLTEASPGVTLSDPADSIDIRSQTIGRALPGLEVMVVDPATGNRLPIGERGELWTRGEHVMRGYDGEPEATKAAITPDGWLRTGDLALERADGRFEIVGRIKELIIRGGENISPAEIEDVLRRHPAVLDAAVFGFASSFFGEEVGAAIRVKPGAQASAVELQSFVKARLADHKVPSRVLFVDAFPLTGSGKVQRFKLKELAERTS